MHDSDAFRDLLAEPSWETLRGYFQFIRSVHSGQEVCV
jgi:hypothetical protein